MANPNLQRAIENWYRINKPFGLSLGYPECCVNAFCDEPPEILNIRPFIEQDYKRFAAAHIDGIYTGFIPCGRHAELILSGEITLASLIKNWDPAYPPFPNL